MYNDGSIHITTIHDIINSIPKLSGSELELPSGSKKLLNIIYSHTSNIPDAEKRLLLDSPKPPLIVSFHPKISLLNNNIQETYLATKFAEKMGMFPLWIPYAYDTGYKTASNKIRLPSYAFVEGKYIPVRSSAQIHGNIMATEKPLNDQEIRLFVQDLLKHETYILNKLKEMLDPINFGHYLFNLKRQVANIRPNQFKTALQELEKQWITVNKGSKRLSDSLGRIATNSLNHIGIHLGLMHIEDVLPEIVELIFQEVLKTSNIAKNTALLENLFLSYDAKTKVRSPILYAGNGNFIAFDESDVKVFEGNLTQLVDGLTSQTILPTGNCIMTIFMALGGKLVLGGPHTIEYYPEYLSKAHEILKETTFNAEMKLITYGNIRFLDYRSLYDVISVIRILDKVGSRNYIKSGLFTIPDDIVDHLNFLAGKDAVPKEFCSVLERIQKKALDGKQEKKIHPPHEKTGKDDKEEKVEKTAIVKEFERNNEFRRILTKPTEELMKEHELLKKWIPEIKTEDLHPIRLEIMLANQKLDWDMRLKKMLDNINYEHHILGGQIAIKSLRELACQIDDESAKKNEEKEEDDYYQDDDENKDDSIIYDGILLRTDRYPTLLELVLYDILPRDEINDPVKIIPSDNQYVMNQIIVQKQKDLISNPEQYSDYSSVFSRLIPSKLLPNILQSQSELQSRSKLQSQSTPKENIKKDKAPPPVKKKTSKKG
jgi:hypothetical protein